MFSFYIDIVKNVIVDEEGFVYGRMPTYGNSMCVIRKIFQKNCSLLDLGPFLLTQQQLAILAFGCS